MKRKLRLVKLFSDTIILWCVCYLGSEAYFLAKEGDKPSAAIAMSVIAVMVACCK